MTLQILNKKIEIWNGSRWIHIIQKEEILSQKLKFYKTNGTKLSPNEAKFENTNHKGIILANIPYLHLADGQIWRKGIIYDMLGLQNLTAFLEPELALYYRIDVRTVCTLTFFFCEIWFSQTSQISF